MTYFLPIHNSNDELEEFTYLFLIVAENQFPILRKNFPQSHLIITREYPQNNIIHILRYFNNFPLFHYFDTPQPSTLHTDLFPTPLKIRLKECSVQNQQWRFLNSPNPELLFKVSLFWFHFDQWLGKYCCILRKNLAKQSVWEQVWFILDTVGGSEGWHNPRKVFWFFPHLYLETLIQELKLTQNCFKI